MIIYRLRLAFAGLSFALATPGFAQTAAPVADEAAAEEEVVITGTRLAVSGFSMPTPVTIVDAAELAASAPNNIGEALAQLPSLAGSVQNTTSGQGSANSQTNGQNLLNLRQLGSERTLVLLDGQRLGVTNVVGAVDINVIPQMLVKRVDVVTGGASASYGSDAVAGVVNFVLDREFEGLKVDFNGGQTTYSDARNGKITAAYGKRLSDRARIIGGLEYFKLDGLNWGPDTGRTWHTNPTMSVANTAAAIAAGGPRWMLIPDVRSRFGTFGGTITAVRTPTATNENANCAAAACTGLVRQEFLPGGATQTLANGTNVFGNNAYVTGGGGAIVNQAFAPTKVERQAIFVQGEFDVSDKLTLWAQGSYNGSETFNQAQVLQSQTTSQLRLYEDNAYLPAAIRTTLNGVLGTQYLDVTRYSRDLGFNEVTGNVYVSRLAAGVRGEINDRWSYDANVGYQDTHQDLDVRTAIMRRLYAAADAVRQDPANPNSAIVCRTQYYTAAGTYVAAGTGSDPGCVPINVIGDGAVTQAAADYVMGVNTADIDLKQSTVDFNVRGDFGESFALSAGSITFAAGLNYRRVTAGRDVDPLSGIPMNQPGPTSLVGLRGINSVVAFGQGGYSYYSPTAIRGEVSAKEAYAEFGVPLLRDRAAAQELSATLAARVTDYSQSGVQNMWKLGLSWAFNDSVRLRTTVSADTRAPTVLELFNSGQVSRGTYSLPVTGLTGSGQNREVGNAALLPEDSKTYTAGFVFSPSFLPGLQTSIDWYKINLLGTIAPTVSQNLINLCATGDQESCSWIRVDGLPVTTTVGLTPANFIVVTNQVRNEPADSYTSGLDFEATYGTAVGPGELNLRLTGLYLLDQNEPGNACAAGALGKSDDLVGAIGNCGVFPKIRGRLSARYEVGRFGMFLQQRYIHNGSRNPNYVTGVDISDNAVPSVSYTDMTFNYGLESLFGGKGEVYLSTTNLFDKAPPPTNSTAGRSWVDPTEEGLYDLLGRRYVLGMRLSW